MEYIVDTQITAANVNDLKRCTTEQLKAEIRRRIEAAKAERANIERCRDCVHMITEKEWWYAYTIARSVHTCFVARKK